MSLIERAEKFDNNYLEKIDPINQKSILRLEEYLFSDWKRPIFLLGAKGVGKTFIAMKALANAVRRDENLLPAMFIYKQDNRVELLNPLRLAPKEIWGKRYDTYRSCFSKEDLLNKANVIVEDDIHYRFEAVADGKEDPEALVKDLKRSLEEIDHNKKVILISEAPISVYTEKLNLRSLEEILPSFGQLPFVFDEYSFKRREELRDRYDPLAFREIFPPNFDEWFKLFEIYDVSADAPTAYLLYRLNPNPRSFIKFFNFFHPNKEITFSDLINKARELLPQKIEKKKQKFYDFLLHNSIINANLLINDVETLSFLPKTELDEIYKNLALIQEICRTASKMLKPPEDPSEKIKWLSNPAYALRKARKRDWFEVNDTINKVLEAEKIPWTKRMRIKKLVTLYYTKPAMKHIKEFYEGTYKQIYSAIENPAFPSKFSDRLLRNFRKYYINTEAGYILIKPFQEIFWDIFYETPSIDLIAERMKTTTNLKI